MRFISTLLLLGLIASPAVAQRTPPAVIAETRAAIAAGDFVKAEGAVAADRKARGVTPENLEAQSWLGRGALAARQYDKAEQYAEATYGLATAELKKRPMDQEPRLPIAIGAAIEVLGQVGAARGERADAVRFLKGELGKYQNTSLYKRIQKNINLISLDGQTAMPLDAAEFVGAKPPSLGSLKGKVVLLFFWAHWCPDCKTMGPVLERLLAKYGPQGFTVVAPTQRYGYVAGGKSAPAAAEMAYIEEVRDRSYPWMAAQPVPVSEKTHKDYGVSTTPTVVLVDRDGLIRLYNPGQMKEEAIEPLVRALVERGASRSNP
ncbi:MAG: TlpA family protein disulfide reductase [Vicinamibacterales bacterium]